MERGDAEGRRTAVLLDSHPVWLAGVRRVLERAHLDVVAETTSTADALEAAEQHRPDVFVSEIDLGAGEDGPGCIRAVRGLVPAVKVIVLSRVDDPRRIDEAFAAGAIAYVIKTARPEDLALAIRQVFDNSVFLSAPRAPSPAPVEDSSDDLGELTPRELEILRLVAEGNSNAGIARTLWVTEQTVKFHLSNIYRKLGVGNRTEASRRAQLAGVLPVPADAAGLGDST